VAFGLPFETVAIKSDIGDMPAWFIAAKENPRDVWAIFVHGIGGVREGGYRYLPLLHDAGFPTLLITYRNDADVPRSKDGVYSFGLAEWPDLEAAVAYAIEAGASSVLLAGDSMGGGVVGEFLVHSGRADAVSAIIMDSPALDFEAVADALAARIGFPAAPGIATVALQAFTWAHGIDLMTANSLMAVATFSGPLLLIHGDGDRIVPISISEHLLAVRRGLTTHLRTGADHLQSRAENPVLYEKTIRDFLGKL
jgi:pimeloyl-ACP methyl ester carboxylesterase